MRRALFLSLCVSLAACSGDPESSADAGPAPDAGRIPVGEPYFVQSDASGSSLVRELALDFGSVSLGERSELKVKVYNSGDMVFEIRGLSLTENPGSAFSHDFVPAQVAPGATHEIGLVFQPSEAGAVAGSAVLTFDGADVPSLALTMGALALPRACPELPAAVAFGNVAPGVEALASLAIPNQSTLPLEVTIGAPEGDDAAFFGLTTFIPGDYTIPPEGLLEIPIALTAQRLGEHRARLPIGFKANCEPAAVELSANAVDHLLLFEPRELDFDFVALGMSSRLEVRFFNQGGAELVVNALRFEGDGAAAYSLPADLAELRVPANGSATLPIQLAPLASGSYAATLRFGSSDPTLPEAAIALRGFGGGPILSVQPAELAIGAVPAGGFRTAIVDLANLGDEIPDTFLDNLLLASRDGSGAWVEKQAELITDSPEQLSLEWPPVGYESIGIAPGDHAFLRVRAAPAAAGRIQGLLRIWSNDRLQPLVEIPVSAEGVEAALCDYEVIGSPLEFGAIEPGERRTLSVYVRNRSANPAETCVIDPARLGAGSAPDFLLDGAPSAPVTLGAGETLEIPVTLAPQSRGTFAGTLVISTSSATAPETVVPLSGDSTEGCLRLVQSEKDFGSIGTGCESRAFSFRVMSSCSSDATITSVELLPGLSTGFSISSPALPFTLAAGATFAADVDFSPAATGPQEAGIRIGTDQGATPLVATVRGAGAAGSARTDLFVVEERPKVDLLIVVDDSGSMYDKQLALASHFDELTASADTAQVDYRIAVTTTSVDPSMSDAANGRFVPLQGTGPRIITPSTPDREAAFIANVNVGTQGSGSEMLLQPIELALSEPLASGHNAGFRRPDANLSVIVVSDAADQGTTSEAVYLAFLAQLAGQRRLSVSAMVPTQPMEPGGCMYDDASAGASTRVRTVVEATGGALEEICSSDWSAAVERIGQEAFGATTRYYLQEIPDFSHPLVVAVDGQPVPSQTGSGGRRWTYDSSENAIVFEPMALPEPGARLTISYQAQCL